ncbi:unnamed protein product [Prorocentrum cordatum]|uniref:Uncharacterized protein n=1 Tax=Prorocentrum cordatum TaxID=2364126 RepID=A0ABN9QB31_9DINO|nr:unnamed protein product [Polarella glacialis]
MTSGSSFASITRTRAWHCNTNLNYYDAVTPHTSLFNECTSFLCPTCSHMLATTPTTDNCWHNFVQRLWLSRDRSFCHCSTFWHALVEALFRDDVGLKLRLPQLAEQRQRPLPLPAFLARADPSVVAR